MKRPAPNRWLNPTVLARALAFAMLLGVIAPAHAQTQDKTPPACWFYKYRWAYFRIIPNTWPPTPFSTSGTGTGMMVTEGLPPNPAETAAITTSIEKGLPRGDPQAPPPQAFIQSTSRVACPDTLKGMGVSLAKIWLKQPSPSSEPGQPARP